MALSLRYPQIDVGDQGDSFAFIYSIEDPKGMSPRQGVGAQVTPTAVYQPNWSCLASQKFAVLCKCISASTEMTQTGPDLLQGCSNVQIMGPGDSYILQFSRNIASFWATPYSLALGASFRPQPDRAFVQPPRQLVTQARL